MANLVKQDAADATKDLEQVLIAGDLRRLSPAQRSSYFMRVCASLGLNPLTRPFQYLVLDGKEVLYATKDATEQLRKIHRISLAIVGREMNDGVYVVVARATTPDGRTDESLGAVSTEGLGGKALANALMKAETKAKRRVTLSICGLGMLDETEVETIPGAKTSPVEIDATVALPREADAHEAYETPTAAFMRRILASSSVDELAVIGKEIGASTLSGTEKDVLKKAYSNRLDSVEKCNAELRDSFIAELELAASETETIAILDMAAERLEAGELSGRCMRKLRQAAVARKEALRARKHYSQEELCEQ